ncbi:MAG: thiamine pyrophosphate-dependent dehydrogenase E1 component subunit alpha [Alphaproteobacteria bacterium]|nr:thiamine pyrophosphate-dependent dehydrogenase E1 component subunit alpha [Alphaproteobacteria bacterium]
MPSPERLKELYALMWRIRLFEEAANAAFDSEPAFSVLHMCCGQEAVEVGVCAALRPDDLVFGNHRSHGHLLAKGGDLNTTMAELFGRATGCCGGKGGSMHVVDATVGFMGANGIVSAGLPIATGAALAQAMTRSGRVVVVFFGDGATHRGAFHEALTLGSLWQLPVVYLCENNGYQQWVPQKEVAPVSEVARMGAAYAIPGVTVDGQDLEAVMAAAAAAVARARTGGGPTLLECRTYRFYGHSYGDTQGYRTAEEVARWRERDPLTLLARSLRERQAMSEGEDTGIQAAAARAVADAVAFAKASPYPSPEVLDRDVFDPAWRLGA